MKWWWVNHSQTREQEVGGGYLWSPKINKDNSRNHTYENMTQVRPGDLVFSYADGKIGGIGIAMELAKETPKPTEFGSTGTNWANTGWFVDVNFTELENALRPKSKIEVIRSLLPQKYSPIREDGNGNQKFYLTEISEELGILLVELIGDEGQSVVSQLKTYFDAETNTKIAEKNILADPHIGDTEKEQLVSARRGQGIFRTRVLTIENRCRVTGVRSEKHLRASHIKPWRLSTNAERLDGHNGLLLSPHIDHLFDQGYISFTDDGQLLISPQLPLDILLAWGVAKDISVGTFSGQQMVYLGFHRDSVFRQ
jgi:hypothetical protein